MEQRCRVCDSSALSNVFFVLRTEAQTVGRCWPNDSHNLSYAVDALYRVVLPLRFWLVWTSVVRRDVRYHSYYFLVADCAECLVVATVSIRACRVALADAGLRKSTAFARDSDQRS